jgi:transposase-like protein
MWSNNKSPGIVVDEIRRRKPPYCPNPFCRFHLRRDGEFRRHGKRSICRFPYVTFRYRCKHCDHAFSSSFFSLNYRDQLPDSYEEIHDLHRLGASNRETARFLSCSEFTVRNRLAKMARWSLLRLAKDRASLKLTEPVAFDGLENFAFSQYDPNNINHVVGALT